MSQDIWDEYEKIAIASGLISKQAESKEDKKPSTKSNSMSDDAISLLYGIEPESIYKDKTLMEDAHPNTVIVGPAYDAMNAVIENDKQRKDVMTWIAQKTPNGQLFQKRYVAAKSNLIQSLVKAGFLLDNRNELELMSLADSCSMRLGDEKILTKQANPAVLGGPVVWGALGVAAIAGLAGYLGYAQTTATNIVSNSEIVLNQLNNLADKPYAKNIRQEVSKLEDMAKKSQEASNNITKLKFDMPKNNADLSAAMKQVDNTILILDNHLKQADIVSHEIPEWIQDIKVTAQNEQEVTSDWYAKVKGLFGRLHWDNAETLIDNLNGLQQAISEDRKNTAPNKQRAETLKQKVEEKLKEQPIQQQEEQLNQPRIKPKTLKEKFDDSLK